MFLKVAKTQVYLYKELIKDYIIKGNSIIEFCQTPLSSNEYILTPFEHKQLNSLIRQVERIVYKLKELNDIKDDID